MKPWWVRTRGVPSLPLSTVCINAAVAHAHTWSWRNGFGDKRSTKAGISNNAYAAQLPMFALRAERDHLRGAASGEVRRSAPNN